MKVEIQCDPAVSETKVVIVTPKIDERILAIQSSLMDEPPAVLTGFLGGKLEIIPPESIIRVYALQGDVIVQTSDKKYTVRLSLGEIECRLDRSRFVRISRSDIINLRKVNNFDLSFSGTISVKMANGDVVYVSRRFLKKVKSVLGI